MNYTKTLISLVSAVLITSCGGGGGSSAPTPAPAPAQLTVGALTGTWYGTLEDGVSVMHTLSVTVNSSGAITQIMKNGVSTGLTGTIHQSTVSSYLFSSALSDGSIVGFYSDGAANHIAFVDSWTNVGVLQKGASNLPVFSAVDIVGTWSGYSVTIDSNMNVLDKYVSGASVAGNYSFSGSNKYGAFTGSLPTADAYFGRWSGTFTQGGVSGAVHTFLSPDKAFAMSWSCPNTAMNFLADCGFSAWNK